MKIDDQSALRPWKPALLVVVTLVLYGRVALYDFVNWDDRSYLQDNPAIHALTGPHLKAILTPGGMPGERLYIPVTYLSHLLESTIFGFSPAVIHTVNVLLHLLNVLLLFGLIRRWTHQEWIAFAAAFIFAVHPLQAESVAWCMGRKELLAAAFALIAMHAWHRWLERPRWPALAAVYGAFALALLSKPGGILLPVALVLLTLALEGRVTRRQLLAAGGMLGLSAVVVWLTGRLAEPGGAAVPQAILLQSAYLPGILTGWLARLLLLAPSRPLYLLDELDPATISVLCVLPCLAVLGLLGIAIRDRRPRAWFGLSFAALTFLPAVTIAVERNRDFITADRYGYLPMAGLSFLAAMLLGTVAPRWRSLYAVVLAVFCLGAFARALPVINAWHDSQALWQRALDLAPGNRIAWNSLGNYYADHQQAGFAENAYEQAATLRPGYVNPHYNLAQLALRRNDLPAAERRLRHALVADPAYLPARFSLARVLAVTGRPEDALRLYDAMRPAVEANPDAMLDNARCYQAAGQPGIAIDLLLHLLDRYPGHTDARLKLAVLYQQTGRPAEAERAYRAVLNVQPNRDAAWYNLGVLYRDTGHTDEARDAFTHALRLNPDDPDYRQALSTLPSP